ncbi:MAG: deoxyribose-phosphate aldolase [Bacteroidota bacterium]
MELAKFIDHTLLRPDCTKEDIARICQEAIEHQFAAVCVPPYYVKNAANILSEHRIKVATVVGFPMGYSAISAKVEEIKRAMNEGVDELDIVVNLNAVKNGDWAHVRNEVDSITRAVHLKGKIIKVIMETGLLEKDEIIRLCNICTDISVDFVKTSTGFSGDGASVEIIELLRSQLSDSIKIKASGGIRTAQQANELIVAGANRLGTSSGIAILAV